MALAPRASSTLHVNVPVISGFGAVITRCSTCLSTIGAGLGLVHSGGQRMVHGRRLGRAASTGPVVKRSAPCHITLDKVRAGSHVGPRRWEARSCPGATRQRAIRTPWDCGSCRSCGRVNGSAPTSSLDAGERMPASTATTARTSSAGSRTASFRQAASGLRAELATHASVQPATATLDQSWPPKWTSPKPAALSHERQRRWCASGEDAEPRRAIGLLGHLFGR